MSCRPKGKLLEGYLFRPKMFFWKKFPYNQVFYDRKWWVYKIDNWFKNANMFKSFLVDINNPCKQWKFWMTAKWQGSSRRLAKLWHCTAAIGLFCRWGKIDSRLLNFCQSHATNPIVWNGKMWLRKIQTTCCNILPRKNSPAPAVDLIEPSQINLWQPVWTSIPVGC